MVAWRSAFLICLAFSLATLVQRGSGDFDFTVKETSSVKQRWDHVTTTTRRPGATRAPAKPPTEGSKFDLADALDGPDPGHRKPSAGGGGDGPYGSGDDSESGMSAETGTIAGVASALAMALIGAVSSYISYQQKKFCFSIQQGLNADYVKGENLEAVVCEEPQVKYSALQTQSAEPPPPEPPRI
ncbi:CD99 antigen-like protein 2 isoform X3 [Hippopotamus amphibius kiboko]|uniref:CD99 antigen-like protein 2 isoform X3 n=1 Tax=Hippopotamus amphibius kiboko TaxID=575201 RepID=UPI002597401A|nr:CD99 antigen-like protein 2 isoform X3 [Hippopotamus amphibius kiboko]